MARVIRPPPYRPPPYRSRPFPFLKLPLEVRRKVYLCMREWASHEHLAVLRVSKQIFAESKESFLQRALVCSSEKALIHRVANASPVVLNQIQTLIISLEHYFYGFEAGPGMLVEPLDWHPPSTITDLEGKLIRTVLTCLTRLPKIKDLSILHPCCRPDEISFKDYFEALAVWLKSNYNHIGSLKLTVTLISMDFIASFQNLHTLCFTGYSLTEARQMSEIFQALDQLQSLTLITPQTLFRPESQWQELIRSIDGEVLRSMKPLKSLTLLECTEQTNEDDEDYQKNFGPVPTRIFPTWLSVDTFTALLDKHGDSLQTLTIRDSRPLSPSVTQSIIAFLKSSTALERLETQLVDAEIGPLDSFSQQLRFIKIILMSDYLPAFGEADLCSIHSALPQLQALDYTVYKTKSKKLLCHFETSEGGRSRRSLPTG